jgi:hypothetical protein
MTLHGNPKGHFVPGAIGGFTFQFKVMQELLVLEMMTPGSREPDQCPDGNYHRKLSS